MRVFAKLAHTAIDPVCNMTVDPHTEAIEFSYEGEIYYFCAEGCRKAFQDCPRKFLAPRPQKKKGWWGRYMDWLQRGTGGKPIKCH
jgi:Cu+-exporting ATPase